MKVYIVQNSDEILLGVFKTKSKARTFVKKYGQKVWNEKWNIYARKINHVQTWIRDKQ